MALPTNQNLEELFDIAPRQKDDPEPDGLLDEVGDDVSDSVSNNLPLVPESLVALDKIEAALPAVKGLEASDQEMDELASKATESFDDLMSLGMQVDSRYASEIFAVAGTMLGHAITAKTAKMNKKLKMIQLQMQKAKLDQSQGNEPQIPNAQGRVLDRNDLLRTIMGRDSETPKVDK